MMDKKERAMCIEELGPSSKDATGTNWPSVEEDLRFSERQNGTEIDGTGKIQGSGDIFVAVDDDALL